MAVREDLLAEVAARKRRFRLAAGLALAAIPALFLLQRLVPPGTLPKWAVITISAAFPLGFLAYLIWDFEVRPNKQRQHCHGCGQPFTGQALRAAIDTSRCTHCHADLG